MSCKVHIHNVVTAFIGFCFVRIKVKNNNIIIL